MQKWKTETRSVDITLPDAHWQHIDRLLAAMPQPGSKKPLESLLVDLLDHVQQGVDSPGSWERDWLNQCVGDDAVDQAYAAGLSSDSESEQL